MAKNCEGNNNTKCCSLISGRPITKSNAASNTVAVKVKKSIVEDISGLRVTLKVIEPMLLTHQVRSAPQMVDAHLSILMLKLSTNQEATLLLM